MNMLILILSMNPEFQPITDHVDRVEVNCVFQECDGRLVFDQVFWSDWNADTFRYDVREWRILKGVRRDTPENAARFAIDHPGETYVPTFIGGHATPRRTAQGWVSEWFDDKTRCWRRVIAKSYLITSSNCDREFLQREILPEDKRKTLTRR